MTDNLILSASRQPEVANIALRPLTAGPLRQTGGNLAFAFDLESA